MALTGGTVQALGILLSADGGAVLCAHLSEVRSEPRAIPRRAAAAPPGRRVPDVPLRARAGRGRTGVRDGGAHRLLSRGLESPVLQHGVHRRHALWPLL